MPNHVRVILPSFTSRAAHHPDLTLKLRPKHVYFVLDSVLATSQSRNSLFVPPQLGPELCSDLNSDGLKLPQEQLTNGWKRWNEGCRTSEGAASCEATAIPFLCPGCVCMSACSNDRVPDQISEPFLTQPFTKLQEPDWRYYAVCLLYFYANLQIKLLIEWSFLCLCF